jgi:hypothetical protein
MTVPKRFLARLHRRNARAAFADRDLEACSWQQVGHGDCGEPLNVNLTVRNQRSDVIGQPRGGGDSVDVVSGRVRQM